MKRTSKLGSLLDLTRNSFNSLCYEDWSTSQQDLVKVGKAAEKTFNRHEKKVKGNH